jgi:tRNA (mo5U34)-methyltransferase
MSKAEAETLVASQSWWYHTFEIAPGVMTPGVYEISGALANMGLPADMTGMRVLEIGPADGAFTKVMWERGADVTAVDYELIDRFEIMRKASGCTAKYIKANVLDIEQLNLGTFDFVLNMGVLYHLPDPLRGLWRMRKLMRPESVLILETLISLREDGPVMEYFSGNTKNHDETNFWAPNMQCLREMLVDCGFTIEREAAGGTRGIIHARLNTAPNAHFKAARAYSEKDAN